jgi:membrane-bound lytic murein transglycosylase D
VKRAYKNLPLFRKVTQALLILVLLITSYLGIQAYLIPPKPNAIAYTDANLLVLDLNIPQNLHFCGEKIPSNDYEIRKDLEKEFFNNSYWKSNSVALFHKAQRWFPYIEPILKAKGIPDDFKYVAVIESHLSNVRSSAGAAGFWQLVPGTAVALGLEVSEQVDERYDVEKATYAACELLKKSFAVFHNWTLTAAAYNRGIGGILKAMKQQKGSNYYDLMLNRETGSFVYRVLAYKTLFSSPGHFGIKKRKWNYYPRIDYRSVIVDSSLTSLTALAAHMQTSPAAIRQHNPWLLNTSLVNVSKKKYLIKVPRKTGDYSGYIKDLDPTGLANSLVPDKLDSLSSSSSSSVTLHTGSVSPQEEKK